MNPYHRFAPLLMSALSFGMLSGHGTWQAVRRKKFTALAQRRARGERRKNPFRGVACGWMTGMGSHALDQHDPRRRHNEQRRDMEEVEALDPQIVQTGADSKQEVQP